MSDLPTHTFPWDGRALDHAETVLPGHAISHQYPSNGITVCICAGCRALRGYAWDPNGPIEDEQPRR